MSFLESYAAFKANGGVYTINNADQMIANRPNEPWYDMLQQLAHFRALGGETVPMSYAAAYDPTKMGNCFSYGMGLEINQERLPRLLAVTTTSNMLTSPHFYNLHTINFGYKTTNLDHPETKEKFQPFKNKAAIEETIQDCHFEYNPEYVGNYIPVIYMIKETGDDFHFCLPHVQHSKHNYNIGISCRDGFQKDVVGFSNLNNFANYQTNEWRQHYELQPNILFIDKFSFAKLATIPESEKITSVQKFTTKIEPNPRVMFCQNVPPNTRRQLDTLQFNTLVHTIKNKQPVLKIF